MKWRIIEELGELSNFGVYDVVVEDQWEFRLKPIQYLVVSAWKQKKKKIVEGKEGLWIKEITSEH